MCKFHFIIVLLALGHAQSGKILGVFPVSSGSHKNLYDPLMTELSRRGHDVIAITPFKHDDNMYKTIHLSGVLDIVGEKMKLITSFEETNSNVFKKLQTIMSMITEMTELTLAHEDVQNLILSNETFDAVITMEVGNIAHKALATHFKASLILLTTMGGSALGGIVGNPTPPSYVPNPLTSFSGDMTFFQRVVNSLIYIVTKLGYNHYTLPLHREMVKKYLPGNVDLDQSLNNVSLVLLNSHPSINQPIPYVPNMIDIGGFHIKPSKKLPQDLKTFLDSSPEGVIYFSLGSNLKSSGLPVEKKEAFLKTFAKLKQKVIWKWEEDTLEGQPGNVMIAKWLPQQEILAHKNVKLFITHGGLLSTTEAVFCGVPVLSIPVFADQKLNAKRTETLEIGITLDFGDVTENSLSVAITELFTNSKYRAIAKEKSELFHDRQRKPLDTAMFWIEYVIRHKGASHLRVSGLELPWYKYLLLDVTVFMIVSQTLFLVACYACFKKCFCKRSLKLKIN